jgi:hypothetical protein
MNAVSQKYVHTIIVNNCIASRRLLQSREKEAGAKKGKNWEWKLKRR